ncbi:MAG: hypothetical protein [Bacteriophage sp.]|nr:MAG: hypothetical protein [Bacteriophage sp.]
MTLNKSNLNNRKGKKLNLIHYTLHFIIILIMITILFSFLSNFVINNMSSTRKRAEANATLFIKDNNIEVKRLVCAGDSDHDGYGTCTITEVNDKKIQLQCISNFLNVSIFKDTSCKEISLININ